MTCFEGKKALLVDTNFSSIPIYEYLVSLGMEVYLIGRNPDDFMAKNIQRYLQVDYSDLDLLQKTILDYQIDYVIPGCNDHSYEICSKLAGRTCLANIDDAKTTQVLLNKSRFRDFSLQHQLPVPQVFAPDTALHANCALIIKPVDAFSGKGITRINQPEPATIEAAIQIAQSHARNGDVIIEEFVEGQLYSHSAFLKNEAIIQDFVVEEHGSANPFVVDTSFVKTDFSPNLLQQIRASIEKIALLLGLKDGLIHTQFICNNDKIWLIEITRRCPGDLYSQLIELSTGYPYAACYTMAFLGQPLQTITLTKPYQSIVRHTITQTQTGVFYHVSFMQPLEIIRYVSIANAGDLLKPSPNGRVGIMFALTKTPKETFSLVKTLRERQIYRVGFIASIETSE